MRRTTNRSATRRVRAALSVAVAVCAVAAVAPTSATAATSAPAAAPGPRVAIDGLGVGVERISVATDDGYGAASITPDGRSIVFKSLKDGPQQQERGDEVYVRDRRTGQTRTEPMGDGWTPAISGDGRQVAATTPLYLWTPEHIQQHSLDLGVLPSRCSRCREPSLSTDGRYLAFGVLRYPQLYRSVMVADRDGGYETIASLDSSYPARPSISGDGRHVAYQGYGDVYVWDRTTSTATGPLEGPATFGALVQLSDDGSKVVYYSLGNTYVYDVSSGSTHLVPNVKGVAIDPTGRYLLYTTSDTNAAPLVLRDLATGTDETVSDQPATAEVDSVSAGGRDVVFQSAANDIVPGDTNGQPDVFVRRFF